MTSILNILAQTPAPVRDGNVLQSHLSELYTLPMIPLWICSIVLVMLIFERFRALRAARILDPALSLECAKLAGERDFESAQAACERSASLTGRAWAQGFQEFSLGDIALEDSLTNSTALAFRPLKKNISGISTIAVIAPLLGLLGTVAGMVLVFDELSISASPDKQAMSEGIMVALFTTVFGMLIAIPGIVAGRYFNGRVRSFAETVEADIERIRYQHLHSKSRKEAPKA